jgi:phenylpropionate dioxygenase-like ring-hydroxylating dioxygenase large terminal subunit
MGQYFRRFWQPVALSCEIAEPDGAPLRVTIMDEHLLAFRDTKGRLGLVDPVCPHRGADLYFGRNEECGLRCVYHGWKFDVDGRCVDMPNAPSRAAQQQDVRIKAYPTREFGDIVWAYLGPGEPPAEVPALEMGLLPAAHRYVVKKLQQCNWAQSFEGAIDTAHFSFLHMPAPSVASNENRHAPLSERRLAWIRNDPRPRFHFIEHDAGFVIGATRTADAGQLDWRITQVMLPSHSTTPSTLPGETYFGYTWVPITDYSCWIYTYAWNPERPIGEEERAQFKAGFGQIPELRDDFVPVRNRDNNYLLDRNDQKLRTYTGVRGVAEQDSMIQESQGLIVDRTREHLTATDAAIVRFRRTVLGGAKALQQGQEPSAAHQANAYTLRGGSQLAGASVPFEEVMRLRFGNAAGHVHGLLESDVAPAFFPMSPIP